MMSMQLVTELGVVDVDQPLLDRSARQKNKFMISTRSPTMKNEVLVKRGLS